ncbi:hypothetical protein CIB84_011009, partial [Bambusicola thoracicus]
QNFTTITVTLPVTVVLSARFHSSFLQSTVARSSTSAAIGSILSSDGILTSSGCCELSCSRFFPTVLKPLMRAQTVFHWEQRK